MKEVFPLESCLLTINSDDTNQSCVIILLCACSQVSSWTEFYQLSFSSTVEYLKNARENRMHIKQTYLIKSIKIFILKFFEIFLLIFYGNFISIFFSFFLYLCKLSRGKLNWQRSILILICTLTTEMWHDCSYNSSQVALNSEGKLLSYERAE